MEKKIYLCQDCHCCPAVEFSGDKVRIGEDENVATLTREEWNILVEKVKSGELGEL
ncbi:MAG: hypothetical protein M0T85_05065 [Dehalococcoidales bacterium]|nr:hypothetical protein [Dehalococcoidales bacterium]